MSLIETQELMATMREIIALLDGAEVKVKDIETKVGGEGGDGGGLSLRREFHIMNMYMMALQRFSGDDTLSAIANKIQSITAALMRLRMLMFAIEEAAAGSLGPLGWAYAGANAIGFGLSLATLGQ
jgi:hypothetical protein